VGTGAAVCVVLFGALPSIGQLPTFLALAAAAALMSTFRLHSPMFATKPSAAVVYLLSLITLGMGPTLLVTVIGEVTQATDDLLRRRPLPRAVCRMASVVIAMQAATLSYVLVGDTNNHLVVGWHVEAVVAAALTYFFVSSALAALDLALTTTQPVTYIWRQNFASSWPMFLAAAAVASVLAEMKDHGGWPLAALGLALTAYLAHREHRVNERVDEEGSAHSLESPADGLVVLNREGRVVFWDRTLEARLGFSSEDVLGRSLFDAVPALAETMVPQVIGTVFATGESGGLEHVALPGDNGRRILQCQVMPSETGVSVVLRDVTDRGGADEALKRSEERYNSAFVTLAYLSAPGAHDGLWDWDLEQNQISFSARWKSMLGLRPTAAFSRPEDWFGRVHSADLTSLKAAFEAHVAGEAPHLQHEYRVRHEDGTYRWMLCRGVAVRRANGRATRISGAQTDITERISVQEQLRHAALHDTLTSLPNRALFMEFLTQAFDRFRRHPENPFAVLFLDIDRFKVVNDSLGHLVGDELLIGISRRLESCLRDGDVLARLGGDEFTVLLSDLTDTSQASQIAERIQSALRAPFFLAGRELFTTASVGIALSTPNYASPEDIMRDADTAMYRAKTLGKARHELFDAGMHAKAVERLGFEHDLRGAIERNEFALHYQPLVSLGSGHWTGFEALLRWDRGGSPVPPSQFIPVAEEMGIIEPLGTWALREACRQAGAWRKQFPRQAFGGITVNVSTSQLLRPDFLGIVQAALQETRLRPGDLRLEITETVLMDDPELAERVLGELRRLGVKIYLDDFGTGFSSLSYLHRFPVDTLKIDRSFVASLKQGSERPAIIESIVALAKTLGTHVIAEGVETECQARELARLGCTEAQGFFFAHPLPANIAQLRLAERQSGADGLRSLVLPWSSVQKSRKRHRDRSAEPVTT